MSKQIINQYGKVWDSFDAIKGGVTIQPIVGDKNYAVVSNDGAPLFGRHRPGNGEALEFIATEWRIA